MHETPNDLRALTELLERSYTRAGEHLRRIVTPERRIPADELVARLPGVQVPNLATVSRAARLASLRSTASSPGGGAGAMLVRLGRGRGPLHPAARATPGQRQAHAG